jgi:hypothetical protein
LAKKNTYRGNLFFITMIGFWIGTSYYARGKIILTSREFLSHFLFIFHERWVRAPQRKFYGYALPHARSFFFLFRKEITERDGTVWGRCGRRIAQVWTVSLPVVVLNSPAVSDPASTTKSNPAFGTARDVVGIVLWAVGLAIETVSDAQKVRRPFLPFFFRCFCSALW